MQNSTETVHMQKEKHVDMPPFTELIERNNSKKKKNPKRRIVKINSSNPALKEMVLKDHVVSQYTTDNLNLPLNVAI